jgi:hypothetical protein
VLDCAIAEVARAMLSTVAERIFFIMVTSIVVASLGAIMIFQRAFFGVVPSDKNRDRRVGADGNPAAMLARRRPWDADTSAEECSGAG